MTPPDEDAPEVTPTQQAEISGDVQDEILAEFAQDAVDRLIERTASLSDQQKRLLKFIEARRRTLSSQREWAQAALGLKNDPNSTHYDKMGDLIDAGFVRKNKNGSVAPNVRGLVEDELSGYDVDEATIDDTYERVLTKLAK